MIATINAAGGDDELYERIATGLTIIQLAQSLGVPNKLLSTYLNRDTQAQRRLSESRTRGASALAEQALGIADGATNDNDRACKLQIDTRKWLASRWDKETYGETKAGVVVNVDLRTLHLDALRKRSITPASLEPPAVTIIESTD